MIQHRVDRRSPVVDRLEDTEVFGPYFGVRLTVLPHYRRHSFIEERQIEVL